MKQERRLTRRRGRGQERQGEGRPRPERRGGRVDAPADRAGTHRSRRPAAAHPGAADRRAAVLRPVRDRARDAPAPRDHPRAGRNARRAGARPPVRCTASIWRRGLWSRSSSWSPGFGDDADEESWRSTVRVSADGSSMLYKRDEAWFIAGTGSKAAPDLTPLHTDDMQVLSDPRAEWRQMYREVWRIERDFFYDPHYHGLDLAAAEKKYAPYLDRIGSRADLNYPVQEMLGELTVGHLLRARRRPAARPSSRRRASWAPITDRTNGRYRFARIYDGENWNPAPARSARRSPGVDVTRGRVPPGGQRPARHRGGRGLQPSSRRPPASRSCCASARSRRRRARATSRWCRSRARRACSNLAWIEGNRRAGRPS